MNTPTMLNEVLTALDDIMGVLKTVSECPHCPNCRDMVMKYLELAELSKDIK